MLVPSPPASAEPAHRAVELLRMRDWTGDIDGMLQRRTLRILVPYSKTLFFLDHGKELGIVAEFSRELESWLNKKHETKTLRIHVAVIPTVRDQLFPALAAGKGDIIAANLTITPERRAEADFTTPWLRDVKEIVVTGPTAPPLASLDELSGKTINVRKSSSYFGHVEALNLDFAKRGLKPIEIRPLDENLEDEDLLEMVNAGLLPLAIVDDHKADVWSNVFGNLKVRRDIAISQNGDIAWAIRKNSPKLKTELDEFLSTHTSKSSFGATIKRRYYSDATVVKNAYSDEAKARFRDLAALFVKYGQQYALDPILLLAQGFQESQLDQKRRSSAGAVGIMQLKPSTAAGKPIGITGIAESADRNVNAGAAYLRHLEDVYINDPGISARNRTLMAFAAYNAGPGNLRKFRAAAIAAGHDPNIWFNSVEQDAARIIGRETVQYVGNIYKYFVAYSLIWEAMQAREKALADGKVE
jgi:membrane-bound lytic murein transglycosylase MltF